MQRKSTQISTSGGEQETDVKELIVSPNGVPSESVTVAIAIPVAKREQVFRNVSGSIMAAVNLPDLDKSITLIISWV